MWWVHHSITLRRTASLTYSGSAKSIKVVGRREVDTDIGDGDRLFRLSQVLEHVLYQDRTLRDFALYK